MNRTAKVRTYRRQGKMEPKKNWFYFNIAIALILIGLGVVSLFWLGPQSTGRSSSSAGQFAQQPGNSPAADFSLTSLDGTQVSLADYKGQVILVNMWATWCPPCKAEMPTINAFYESHRDDGFVVLAVNSQEGAATVRNFIESNGFSFPVLLDPNGEVMDRYHVRALPTSFIIDRNGMIQHIQSGEISTQQLTKIVEPLL